MPIGPVFISHSSRDAALAHELVAALEAIGVSCWISGRDVAPGANYQEAIVAAIRGGRAMVVLVSEAANTSDEVKKELSLASAAGVAVYPVRLGAVTPNAALSYELATRQWIEGTAPAAIAVRLAEVLAGAVAASPSFPSVPERPSLVVLPFQNMSADPEQEYFVDGLVEDITTALSRIRSLFVIARNSAFTFKGRAVDVREIGRALGVRYVLEGSVRKVGGRVRITGQLIEAATGAHLWADRFDGGLVDVFDMQDRVTTAVAGAIEPQLQKAEIARAQAKPTNDLDAYDSYLRGIALLHEARIEAYQDAQALLADAIAADPKFGAAHAALALTIAEMRQFGLIARDDPVVAEGVRHADLATEFGRDDAIALASAGRALAWLTGDLDAARHLAARACEINPNSALARRSSGAIALYSGESDLAIDQYAMAIRLSPVDPQRFLFLNGIGWAHLIAGRPADALDNAEASLAGKPAAIASRRLKVIALIQLGRLEEARHAMAEVLRQVPNWRLATALDGLPPFVREQDRTLALEALRQAGMPE